MKDKNIDKEIEDIVQETISALLKEQSGKYLIEISELREEVIQLKERLTKLEEGIMWAAHNMQLNL